jgi:hypothetical protein
LRTPAATASQPSFSSRCGPSRAPRPSSAAPPHELGPRGTQFHPDLPPSHGKESSLFDQIGASAVRVWEGSSDPILGLFSRPPGIGSAGHRLYEGGMSARRTARSGRWACMAGGEGAWSGAVEVNAPRSSFAAGEAHRDGRRGSACL